ncbi:probable TPI1-triose-phosphate isomerase [Serendipita indica DSM 11827]|uniref:Triosephosphate isomerase n=1 Tax=Serendipita indica (strain DSM 11827) TaxID=1109443 RepID=G4T820_SERID|nr:probable TPI1-triose-phosphate isomerase [Serendipita indica DSM 11827]
MNGSKASLIKLVEALNDAQLDPNTEVVIAPPSLYLLTLQEIVKNGVQVAAQNAYFKESGAYTGEISPVQLKDAGINWVVLGHSERRSYFAETSEVIAKKTEAALAAGLSVILCVGETLEEREAGKTAAVVEAQLVEVIKVLGQDASKWSKIVIAYEPVWAIGTGKVATAYISKEVSQEVAETIRIIYGGSVTGTSCGELSAQPDVDGFLVGGASLKPEFINIINVNQK